MGRAKVRFNYHDYLLLPEDKRYEILDGEMHVVPAPNVRHQTLLMQMADVLLHHTRGKDLGKILIAPCDVILSDENVVQPDILFVSKERLGIVGEVNIGGAPDLVIEILSPGSRQKDLEVKRKIYAGFGVREYWIVDPDAQTIEVLVLRKQRYLSAGTFHRFDTLNSPSLPEFNPRIADLFAVE